MRIPSFSNIGFRMRRGDEILMFLLGLFSTWQILQFAGFSLSTWLTVLTAGYLILTRRPVFRKDWLLIALLLCSCITTVFSCLSDIPAGYKKAAILGLIQWFFLFLVCIYSGSDRTAKSTSAFFRGFDWSCRIQLVWCFLQILLYTLLDLDLNDLVFRRLLHFSGETSQYRNGVLACTGLHWHASNLIPIVLYLYWRHRSVFVKLACFVVVYYSKNATAMICMILCVGVDFLRFSKRTLFAPNGSILKKSAVLAVFVCIGALIISPVILPKLWEMVQYLLTRFYQIWNPTVGNESSAVHFDYYQNLPLILSKSPFWNVLFGYGFDTSGYPFSRFYGQYADIIWVVESDFVNLIISTGLLGCLLRYLLMICTAVKLWRKKSSPHFVWWLLILIPCGIIYNNQFLWTVLIEMLLWHVTAQEPPSLCACNDSTDPGRLK